MTHGMSLRVRSISCRASHLSSKAIIATESLAASRSLRVPRWRERTGRRSQKKSNAKPPVYPSIRSRSVPARRPYEQQAILAWESSSLCESRAGVRKKGRRLQKRFNAKPLVSPQLRSRSVPSPREEPISVVCWCFCCTSARGQVCTCICGRHARAKTRGPWGR